MEWLLLLLVVAVIVIGAVAFPQVRSRALRQRFGPEYDRVVEAEGGRRNAESQLRQRVKRRASLQIRDLEPGARDAYAKRWLEMQQRFIDEPKQTVLEADDLVQTVMLERGYPVDELDERIEMMTVDHPELAENYRLAHAIQLRSREQQEASTDELRSAFQLYRALFAALLAGDSPDEQSEVGHEESRDDHLPEREHGTPDSDDEPRERDVR